MIELEQEKTQIRSKYHIVRTAQIGKPNKKSFIMVDFKNRMSFEGI